VAWTPEGYYATSANGEKMMSWLTNNGNHKLATLNAPSSFRKLLYKPDALRELWLAGGNIQLALAPGSGRGSSATTPARDLAPTVIILSPAAGAKLTRRFQVRAEATSKGDFPVTSMRLLVDGGWSYGGSKSVKIIPVPRLGTVSMTWDIDL